MYIYYLVCEVSLGSLHACAARDKVLLFATIIIIIIINFCQSLKILVILIFVKRRSSDLIQTSIALML